MPIEKHPRPVPTHDWQQLVAPGWFRCSHCRAICVACTDEMVMGPLGCW
jgi:hypothetical protein